MQCIASGNLSLTRRLLDTADVIRARDATGSGLLHIAAREGHADICSDLLERDATLIDVVDGAGARALDVATCPRVRAVLTSAQPCAACGDATETLSVEDEEVEEGVSLHSLPLDLCDLVLFACIDTGNIAPILRLRESCHRLREVCNSERLWEHLCWTHFKVLRKTDTSYLMSSWREVYVEHRMLQANPKRVNQRNRDQRHADRRERAGLRSTVSDGEVEGTIWGIGNVRVSVEGTIWDVPSTSAATASDAELS